ncbi:MAG: diguanylate cyclase [Holophagales bacterium]|jgi:transcriptional regulator with PAS, ATPase and Fis domain|nr:diguanylate cyclase [Holophagales bacterium]MBK9968291.1 diguanylate cyclase [Holophagales bacterium]
MEEGAWVKELKAAITVCDRDGIVLEMNDRAAVTHEKDGGRELIGQSLVGCHPEPSRSLLLELLQTGRLNVYTIEKAGVKKLIYQAPWFRNGEYQGLVELSLPIPFELPQFVRT